jgi:hypothetical protein
VLAPEFFQIAYVTTDLDEAMRVMKARYAIADFTMLENDLPDGSGTIRIAVAWVGGVMLELIHAKAEGTIYTAILPAQGFAIRHHHYGYFIGSDPEWDRLHDQFRRDGWSIVFAGEVPDLLRVTYVEAPELGHYLEYIQPTEAGKAFFANVAAS